MRKAHAESLGAGLSWLYLLINEATSATAERGCGRCVSPGTQPMLHKPPLSYLCLPLSNLLVPASGGGSVEVYLGCKEHTC